ncbi:MAG: hypothetical protein ABI832_11000 [bacterium]
MTEPKPNYAAEAIAAKTHIKAAQTMIETIVARKDELNEQLQKLKEANSSYIDIVAVRAERDFTLNLIGFLREQTAKAKTDLAATRDTVRGLERS